jgi:hypothetical protein
MGKVTKIDIRKIRNENKIKRNWERLEKIESWIRAVSDKIEKCYKIKVRFISWRYPSIKKVKTITN